MPSVPILVIPRPVDGRGPTLIPEVLRDDGVKGDALKVKGDALK